MDEILLTHDELLAENQKAHEVWEALHGQDGEVKWGEWWYVWLLRAQVQLEACGEFFEAGLPVRAVIEFVLVKPPSAPKKRRWPTTKPDLDNTEKLVGDALERFLYSNDAQIVDVRKRKVYGATPCIRLFLSEAEPEPDAGWWEQMTRVEPGLVTQSYSHAGLRTHDLRQEATL